MVLFTAGLITGLMACVMIMLIRCAAWYEAKHPEEDYWHRKIWRKEQTGQKSGHKDEPGLTAVQGFLDLEAKDEERN